MKFLRFAGIGILIWGASLVWPQVNQVLSPPVMMAIILGLGVATLSFLLIRRLGVYAPHNGATGPDQPSRPIPLSATR